MNLGYQGPAKLKISGKNPLPHVPNTRLIMRGSPLSVSLVVRKDSPIKTVHDIKGKRVTGEYPANIAIWFHVYAELANAGLTWDDVKVVPVPAVNDGVDALVQGRADVSNHAIGVAKIKEADAAVGVRYLSLDCSPQGDARVRKAVPGYYLITLKSGSSTGIVGDTCVLAYDIYMVGHKGLANEVVAHSLKAIWDNIDKLPPLNPQFKSGRASAPPQPMSQSRIIPRPCNFTKRKISGTPRWTKRRSGCWRLIRKRATVSGAADDVSPGTSHE